MKRTLVFRTAYQQLGDAEEAKSVSQEVFIRLWKNLGRFDPERRFDTWLYRLTVNASIDSHRRRKVRGTEVEFDETFELPASPSSRTSPMSATGPFELAEVQRILTELTGQLTEKQRTAFLLREVEGLPTADVASVLKTTESTVRNHIFQARKLLREALAERYPEYLPGGPEGANS